MSACVSRLTLPFSWLFYDKFFCCAQCSIRLWLFFSSGGSQTDRPTMVFRTIQKHFYVEAKAVLTTTVHIRSHTSNSALEQHNDEQWLTDSFQDNKQLKNGLNSFSEQHFFEDYKRRREMVKLNFHLKNTLRFAKVQ